MARKTTRKGHTHKFHKIQGKVVKAWRCADSECKYILHSGLEELLLGRASICWNCSESFPMDEINLKEDMPVCQNCRIKQEVPELAELEKFLANKGV